MASLNDQNLAKGASFGHIFAFYVKRRRNIQTLKWECDCMFEEWHMEASVS